MPVIGIGGTLQTCAMGYVHDNEMKDAVRSGVQSIGMKRVMWC